MTTTWRSTTWLLLGASLILALSLGTRHGFGLFLPPMSAEFGWGREVFAFAIAVQNLIWGLVQPVTGALADRFGVAARLIHRADRGLRERLSDAFQRMMED